jgi:hypothetical protein
MKNNLYKFSFIILFVFTIVGCASNSAPRFFPAPEAVSPGSGKIFILQDTRYAEAQRNATVILNGNEIGFTGHGSSIAGQLKQGENYLILDITYPSVPGMSNNLTATLNADLNSDYYFVFTMGRFSAQQGQLIDTNENTQEQLIQTNADHWQSYF